MGNVAGSICGSPAYGYGNEAEAMRQRGIGGDEGVWTSADGMILPRPKPNINKDSLLQRLGQGILGIGSELFRTPAEGERANILGPVLGGLAAGKYQADWLKDQPQSLVDPSGIDIADIRSRALTGSDPGLHFLPKGEATTAYAQGGRTRYATGDRVDQNMITAFSTYKNAGGKEDFNGWFSNVWLPETTMGITPEAAQQTRGPDESDTYTPTPDWYKDPFDPQPERAIVAQGGRIGYDNGGPAEIGEKNISDILARVQELQDEGLDFGAAMVQAMKELSQGKAHGGRIRAQEGGLMNLGGMEKDYRQDGGFVPLGGEERADDVPARLSKNEFVFTADAVRSAGGGDIDAGAEVMENVMENLEQGGQISEESQGLEGIEGARDMFTTAQRLEGVL